ncbi:MAG: polysaccharide pyruvyl transferase family protein [Planctomycetota bacterium]|nr:polysaccharide pyruvyl transferase family protein [Planctomycetota bacterium]
MRLCYWDDQPNFGDALNPWLFPRLLPGRFDKESDTRFLGIGTILGHCYPAASRKVVFSSGYVVDEHDSYGPRPTLDETWDVVCVRGPLTAEALGLSADAAVTDGATLLRFVELPEPAPATRTVFMPHLTSTEHFDWAPLCEDAGITYVDPRRSVDDVLAVLQSAALVLAEAMHAAVVADTLRIPWVPVRAYPTVHPFKWRDWTASLELAYEPVPLPELRAHDGVVDVPKRRFVPRPLRRLDRARRRRGVLQGAVRALKRAAASRAWLSDDAVYEARSTELRERLERLAQ